MGEAPFTSVPDAAASQLGGCLTESMRERLSLALDPVLSAHQMASKDRISQIAAAGVRVQILHGTKDKVVPHSQGRQLANIAAVPLHSFDRDHEDIVRDPSLGQVLKTFFAASTGCSRGKLHSTTEDSFSNF